MTGGADDHCLSSAFSASGPPHAWKGARMIFMKHLKKSKRPVEGKAKAYQRLRDSAARTHVYEAIRQGLGDTASGRTFPARKVFEELRAKHGIPR